MIKFKKIIFIAVVAMLSLTMLFGCMPNEQTEPEVLPSEPSETSQPETTPEQQPPASQDAFLPKIAIYNGNNYLLTNDSDIDETIIGEKLGDSSGFIDFNQNFDQALLTTDFANSFSETAEFYSVLGYDDGFRIAIFADGVYYILESINISADNIKDHADIISGATIKNISGTTELSTVSKDDVIKMLDAFSKTTKAELSNEEYENIAGVQSEGKAFQLCINFSDNTATTFVVMPSLNLVSIGQTYYTSQTLNEDIAEYFNSLESNPNDIMN